MYLSPEPAEQHSSMTTVLKKHTAIICKSSRKSSLVLGSALPPFLSLQEKNKTAGSVNNHLIENTNG